MLKKTLLLLAVLIAILLAVVLMQPDDFRIERSVTIAAPASVAFSFVNDFHRFTQWNPFAMGEADLTETFSGPDAGVGAGYAWKGTETGEGRMTILESRPDEYVAVKLEFLAPMEATDLTEYTITPVDGGVSLTWAMSGPNLFLGKVMNLFGGMEKMVGPEFERGLANLKARAEAEVAAGKDAAKDEARDAAMELPAPGDGAPNVGSSDQP